MAKRILWLAAISIVALTACGPRQRCTKYERVTYPATPGWWMVVGKVPVFFPGTPEHRGWACVAWAPRTEME